MENRPLQPHEKPDPKLDGIDHINLYSKGKTPLGQALSNFAHKPFRHPQFGFFASVEAFWYWLSTGMKHEHLRRLYGASAKTAGIRLLPERMDTAVFEQHIRDAIKLKIAQNPKLREAVKKSTLPFRHYFVYGTNPPVIRDQIKHHWQVECLETIREELQAGQPLLLADGSRASEHGVREEVENPIPEDMEPFGPRDD